MSIDAQSSNESSLTINTEQLDRICLEFEDAWQAGENPVLTNYLNGHSRAERSYLLRELLLLEVEYLSRRGITPVVDDYFVKFPDDRSLVASVFQVRRESQSTELDVGQRIGRFSIERKLGSGSFGTVYQAWDSDLGRMVALKVPKLERFTESRDIEDFVEEARTTAKLDHPAIVPVLDVVRDSAIGPILVLQYIDGCSLRDRILAQPLTIPESIDLLAEVAEAIDYAHRRGFVHRDLEPRNILLDSNGTPHITDFGLAVHESTQSGREGESAGSLAYMSPEQVRGDSHWLDGRSDIWALGVILYELLAGRRPFSGRNFEEIASEIFVREPKPLRQISAEIPAILEQICLTCLSKNVLGRYATGKDLADALRGVACSLKPPVSAANGNGHGLTVGSQAWIAAVPRLTIGISLLLLILLITVASRGGSWLLEKTPPPVVQDIELAVWSQTDEFRGRINRTEQSASPLRTGDKIRLSVTLSGPAYLYVFWIGVDGDLTPIYPWPAGKWERPAREEPISSIHLPVSGNSTWQILPGPGGTETIMAIVARRPLATDLDFRQLSFRGQNQKTGLEPLWFDNGILAPKSASITRSPDVSHIAELHDVIISNQLVLSSFTDRHCSSGHALVVPIQEH